MALPPLATAAALSVWLNAGAFSTEEEAQAEQHLVHASTAVRVVADRTWVNAAGDTLEGVPLGIPEIVIQIAARTLANPTGAASKSTGPFAANLGAVELTDGEKAAIARAVNGAATTPGLWVLGVSAGDYNTGTVYLPVVGGEPIIYLDDRNVI